MILPMTSWYNSYVLATDIINLWYWGRLISFFLWYLSLYHGTWATVRLGLGAPLASRSTSRSNFQVEHTNLEQVGCPAHIQSCNPSWLLTVVAFTAFQDKATQAYCPAVTQPGARRADSESLTGAAWPPQASRCQKEAVYKVSLDLSSCTSANNWDTTHTAPLQIK